jgi:type IV pilus assembly protein PilN
MTYSYRSIVGIDLHGETLRYVELVRGIRRLRLGGHGILDLSPEEMEVSSSGRDAVIRKIQELVRSGEIRARHAVVGLPRERYFFRKMTFPPVSGDKLRPMIENQAERIFPIRGEQLVYDYQVTDRRRNGGMGVILAGARRADVDEVQSIIKAAGLMLLRVDMREISLANLLRSTGTNLDGPHILLSIDEDAVSCHLLVSGHPVICRSTCVPKGKVNPEFVVDEFEKVISFYGGMARENETIESVYITGDEELLNWATPVIEEALNGEIRRLDPRDMRLNLPSGFDIERFGYPLGLALSGYQEAVHTIDLQPKGIKKKRERDEWIRLGVVSMTMIFTIIALSAMSMWRKDTRLREVRREIASIEGKVKAVKELKLEYEGLADRVRTLNKLQSERPHWLAVLANLSKAIPEEAWLTSIDMEQGEPLKISGNASTAATLIPLLENSPYLKNVKFEAPTTTRDFGGEEVESFRITADIDWSGGDQGEAE